MLVPDLTYIDWTREQMVKRSTRERLAAADVSLPGDLGPRDDPALFQIFLQVSDAAATRIVAGCSAMPNNSIMQKASSRRIADKSENIPGNATVGCFD